MSVSKSGFERHHVHAATVLIECHLALDEREDGMISAEADVTTGDPLGATLTEDDVASDDVLTAELLHAETLAAAVASVLD